MLLAGDAVLVAPRNNVKLKYSLLSMKEKNEISLIVLNYCNEKMILKHSTKIIMKFFILR